MSEQRCQTCRWWDRSISPEPQNAKCLLTIVESGDTPNHPESKALAYDAESYYAALHTDADFGCVQWQAKDSE